MLERSLHWGLRGEELLRTSPLWGSATTDGLRNRVSRDRKRLAKLKRKTTRRTLSDVSNSLATPTKVPCGGAGGRGEVCDVAGGEEDDWLEMADSWTEYGVVFRPSEYQLGRFGKGTKFNRLKYTPKPRERVVAMEEMGEEGMGSQEERREEEEERGTGGANVGREVGSNVGKLVGNPVGAVGAPVGKVVGLIVGLVVGNLVGSGVGKIVGGAVVGVDVGFGDGEAVGEDVVGGIVGNGVGDGVGKIVGRAVGSRVGKGVGSCVGKGVAS